MRVRKEVPSDIAGVEAVTIAAFQAAAHTRHTEQFIVRALRDSGQLAVSLVADNEGSVVGHVAVSPVTISSGAQRWYGLGPISVTPEHQKKGVGAQLMEHALAELRTLGAGGCVVLGEPSYYSRFGFNAESSLVLPGVPAEYFQAISFNGSLPLGTVSYHDSFEAKV
jgi:putative acetyltransferase